MNSRIEDSFKTQVGAQASRINDLLLKHPDREWTVSDVAAMTMSRPDCSGSEPFRTHRSSSIRRPASVPVAEPPTTCRVLSEMTDCWPAPRPRSAAIGR